MIQIHTPLFSLGKLVATPSALAAIKEEGKRPFDFVARHARGDWGDDLSEEDRLLNDESVKTAAEYCPLSSCQRAKNASGASRKLRAIMVSVRQQRC